MSRYNLSLEDKIKKQNEMDQHDIPSIGRELYFEGVEDIENRLIPLLEERDRLLSDCKDFISLIAGHPDFQKERKELLAKLNDICVQ